MPFSGKKLKQCRDRHKWSLSDLSEYSGVNKGYLSNLENGVQNNPGLDIVEKLSEVFSVPLDYFSDSHGGGGDLQYDYPTGLRQFIQKAGAGNQPLDRKSVEFLKQVLDRGPSNWSAQEWESVYRSYRESLPKPRKAGQGK